MKESIEVSDLSFSNEVKGTIPDVLYSIHSKDKNIVIYERTIFHLQNDLNCFLNSQIEFRHSGSVQEIQSAIREHFKSVLLNCSALFKDIFEVLSLFQEVSKSKSFRLFLTTVNSNMCQRFHTDINDLRLLCTYDGQGTLWLPEIAVNRQALDTCGDNDCIVTDPMLIQQVGTGHISIIKGAIYPKEGTKALVHRSPTIEETGENRLLLRIDTNEFLDFE